MSVVKNIDDMSSGSEEDDESSEYKADEQHNEVEVVEDREDVLEESESQKSNEEFNCTVS